MPDNICSALARRRATARTTRQSLPKFGKDARNGPRDLLQLPEYIAGIGWHGACTMMRRGRFLEEDEIGHGERRLYRAVATTLPAARTRRRREQHGQHEHAGLQGRANGVRRISRPADTAGQARSEEHTSELQTQKRISYAD